MTAPGLLPAFELLRPSPWKRLALLVISAGFVWVAVVVIGDRHPVIAWVLGGFFGLCGGFALVALLPVPPIALVLHAMIGYIRDIDELQQRIELEAICIAAAGVSLAYMTGGFLQGARVIDVPASAAMLWVFPAICGVYGLAKLVVARRYR